MFTPIDDTTYDATLRGCEAGVALFHKKLCPHCKNMEKVLEKFSGQMPGVSLFSIDIEENPAAAQAFGAERAPTILVIKNGSVTGQKAGLMNPKEMLAFYKAS
ncbi:thioredoxin family protein [uncultured Desulfovibrio sp.]|uniref:thioredoxin family protein n=1 Tax=uncultured Desulfovibrio sp. TaxID=167968 RepID=UPI002614967C|nr:thioredoxin family protein [uncultured Desulfovibrio sp.]